VALSQRQGDKWGLVLALNPLEEVCMLRHDYAAARSRFAESLALFDKQGNEQGVSKCRAGLAALNAGAEADES
jgi:hypothetical protein